MLKLRTCQCDRCGHKEITQSGTQCRKCWEGKLLEPTTPRVFSFTHRDNGESMVVIIDTFESNPVEDQLTGWCNHRGIAWDRRKGFTEETIEAYINRIRRNS